MQPTSDWRVMRTFGRDVWLMLAVFAISGFGYFGVQAVLLNLYLRKLGYDAQFIGGLIGFGQVVWALIALPAGAIGRRWGTQLALVLWHSLHAAGLALMLLSGLLPQALWTPALVLGWAIFWIGGAFGGANAGPFMMRVAPANARNLVFSAQVATFSIMGFIGSWVAGVLPGAVAALSGVPEGDASSYRLALWLTPIAHVLCVVVISRIRNANEDASGGVTLGILRPTRTLVFWGVLMYLLTASEGAVRAFFNVYLADHLSMSTAAIGQVFGIGQFISILGALAAPVLMRHFGAPKVIWLTTAGVALGLLTLSAVPLAEVASLAYISMLLLSAIATAARSVMSQEIVQPRWRTVIAAVQTVGLGLGWASAAAIGGAIVTGLGFASYFAISAALAAAAAVLVIWYMHRRAVG